MPEVSFAGLVAVAAIAVLAPLLLALAPAVRLPAVVLELLAGIAVGPSGLGWVELDLPLEVLSVLGLAFLLFLAGLEIDLPALRGPALRLAAIGFALSAVLAVGTGRVLSAVGLADAPLLVAIVLLATSLGVVVPVLKDAGEVASGFGQLVIAAASIADFGAIILLSLLFSRDATSTSTRVALLVAFAAAALVAALAILGAERWRGLSAALLRLQDTTAQIRVRAAFALVAAFAALASALGLEVILGAFVAGVVVTAVDRDEGMLHAGLRQKLEAVGFGVLIPVFFVTSGLRFDLDALLASTSTLVLVPVFLAALVLVRGLPAVLYRGLLGSRRTAVAGLLQATSLPFVVAATAVGVEIGALEPAVAAALVAAGLLSVVLFPLAAVTLLGRAPAVDGPLVPQRAPAPAAR